MEKILLHYNMGNIPSSPPVPRPVPIPVKKNFRKFRDWDEKRTEKIMNEYLLI